jgi:hypothetical protein
MNSDLIADLNTITATVRRSDEDLRAVVQRLVVESDQLRVILCAYAEPNSGIMPLMNACRSAMAWRGAELERQKSLLNQWHERM